MAEDIKVNNLIINQLSKEKFATIEKDPTQLYLTPDTSIDASEKGVAGGVATLDSNAKVPTDQIPALPYLPKSGGTMSGYINMVTGQNIKFLQTGMQIFSNYGNSSQIVISFANDAYPNDGLSISKDKKECYVVKNGVTNKIINESDKGIANGVASLGADGKVPAEQLPETALPDNYDYVVEQEISVGMWYRKWKSGFLEQIGSTITIDQEVDWTETFYRPFSKIDMVLVVPCRIPEETTNNYSYSITYTNTSFTVHKTGTARIYFKYYAFGTGA